MTIWEWTNPNTGDFYRCNLARDTVLKQPQGSSLTVSEIQQLARDNPNPPNELTNITRPALRTIMEDEYARRYNYNILGN